MKVKEGGNIIQSTLSKEKIEKRNHKRSGRPLTESEVDLGDRGIFDKRNKLNELTGKEWTRFNKSWFIFDALPSDLKEERDIDKTTEHHPATYSPTLMAEFISFFTKKGQVVLDPFVGIGSTLVGCDRSGRKGIGIDINKKYLDIAKKRTKQLLILGDASEIEVIASEYNFPPIDFCISSPPYWDILNRSTASFERKRVSNGFDVKYSDKGNDLGNIEDYETFLDKACKVYEKIYDLMRNGAYICVIVKNIKKGGKLYPLAWDIARRLSNKFVLKDEKIWCQNRISLAPYGYPYAWSSNIVHHYCIILRKEVQKMD